MATIVHHFECIHGCTWAYMGIHGHMATKIVIFWYVWDQNLDDCVEVEVVVTFCMATIAIQLI